MQTVKNSPIVPSFLNLISGKVRVWKKKYRNKLVREYGVFYEHVYDFLPTASPIENGEYVLRVGDKTLEIRVYTNQDGNIIWVAQEDKWISGVGMCNVHSPEVLNTRLKKTGGHQHYLGGCKDSSWTGWKKEWVRSYSDVKFLLTHTATREDFLKKLGEHRTLYMLYPTLEVEQAVDRAVANAEAGNGRPRIRSYSGPASVSVEELKKLGVKFCHTPPTKKNPAMAGSDYVRENFNWGANKPKRAEWFRYGAGYQYNGSVGCNAGWIWYA